MSLVPKIPAHPKSFFSSVLLRISLAQMSSNHIRPQTSRYQNRARNFTLKVRGRARMSVLITPLGIILELTTKGSNWEVSNWKVRSSSVSVCRWLNHICWNPQHFMKLWKSLNESCKSKATSQYTKIMYVCMCVSTINYLKKKLVLKGAKYSWINWTN